MLTITSICGLLFFIVILGTVQVWLEYEYQPSLQVKILTRSLVYLCIFVLGYILNF